MAKNEREIFWEQFPSRYLRIGNGHGFLFISDTFVAGKMPAYSFEWLRIVTPKGLISRRRELQILRAIENGDLTPLRGVYWVTDRQILQARAPEWGMLPPPESGGWTKLGPGPCLSAESPHWLQVDHLFLRLELRPTARYWEVVPGGGTGALIFMVEEFNRTEKIKGHILTHSFYTHPFSISLEYIQSEQELHSRNYAKHHPSEENPLVHWLSRKKDWQRATGIQSPSGFWDCESQTTREQILIPESTLMKLVFIIRNWLEEKSFSLPQGCFERSVD